MYLRYQEYDTTHALLPGWLRTNKAFTHWWHPHICCCCCCCIVPSLQCNWDPRWIHRQWSSKDRWQWWRLSTHFCHFLSRTRKSPLTMLASGGCRVSFLECTVFNLGVTMLTDWLYLRGHRGSEESSNFFWHLLRQFFGPFVCFWSVRGGGWWLA